MTKKILPVLIGAAIAGGMSTASADVAVGGHIDMSVNNQDQELRDTGGILDMWDDTNLHCTTCSLGFSGKEDLGNGLSAIFKLDFQFDMVNRNSSGSITDRDQWVGLAGGFGQIRVGTISTVYKSHGASIDPMYRRSVQARDVGLQSDLHSGAGEDGQGRATNTFRWDSADFNGLKIGAHYTLDSDETDGNVSNEDNNPFGIGASYSFGGGNVFADYITNDGDGNANQNELTAWKIGGKYSMDAISVFGQYESIEDDFSDMEDHIDALVGNGDLSSGFGMTPADLDGEIWHIGGTYTMGSNVLYAAYGQGDFDSQFVGGGPTTTIEYDTWTIAGIHNMSKRTSAYAAYNDIEAEQRGVIVHDGESQVFSVGVKHKF